MDMQSVTRSQLVASCCLLPVLFELDNLHTSVSVLGEDDIWFPP